MKIPWQQIKIKKIQGFPDFYSENKSGIFHGRIYGRNDKYKNTINWIIRKE